MEGIFATVATAGAILATIGNRAVTIASAPIVMFEWQFDALLTQEERERRRLMN